MSVVAVVINFEKMKVTGTNFDTWIVTGSDTPPMVCLGAQANMHCNNLMARKTPPSAPKGVWITGFCNAPISANSSLVINLIQDGMTGQTPTKPT